MYQMAAMLLATTIAGSSATGGMPTADLNKICNQPGTKDCPIVQQVTGTSLEDLKQQLKDMGIQIDWNNCPDFNFPGVDMPNPDKPETDKPETDKPEITPQPVSYTHLPRQRIKHYQSDLRPGHYGRRPYLRHLYRRH